MCYNILWTHFNASEKPHSEEPCTLYSWILYSHFSFCWGICRFLIMFLSPSVRACILSCFSNSRTYWDQAYLSLQLLTLQKPNKHPPFPPPLKKKTQNTHTPSPPKLKTLNSVRNIEDPQSSRWISFGFGLSRLAQQFMVVCWVTGVRTL